MKILFVEDEAYIRESVSFLLEEDGHRVVSVGDGEAAIAELQRDSAFDVIVTDHNMPNMSGGELAAIVRARWCLPVLVATAYMRTVARQADVPILPKPYSIEELEAALDALIRTSRSAEPPRRSTSLGESGRS